jgi:hypothetical protein
MAKARRIPLPDGITKEDLIAAMAAIDQGVTHAFADSTKFDVLWEGKRYPPKAVVGIAAARVVGDQLTPKDFTGGLDSQCFKLLAAQGIPVVRKLDSDPIPHRSPGQLMFWWVNHKQTFRQEVDGGYLWSPKRNKNGSFNQTYVNMTRALPGDVVFSYASTKLQAIGIVTAEAVSSPKPKEFGKTGDNWGDDGWHLATRFTRLKHALVPKAHMGELAPLLPKKNSPIRATGDGNQGCYLAEIPAPMAEALRLLLGGQLEAITADRETLRQKAVETIKREVISEETARNIDPESTEKETIVKARQGQALFRERVIALEGGCRVTSVTDPSHLRASHIKPWRVCDDRERLDGNNGLLLAPHIDHLFDKGFISFTDAGDLIRSAICPIDLLESWGLPPIINVGAFRPEQWVYLQYHRLNVLIG